MKQAEQNTGISADTKKARVGNCSFEGFERVVVQGRRFVNLASCIGCVLISVTTDP